jgi:DNA-directed RNA polymerase subunit RPC12/RpoP
VVAQATKSTEVKSAKGQGALSGLFVGMGCSVVCIIVGLSLCFTGIGAIVGIPLIIVGLCGPILGLFAGMKLVKGECPWCQTMVTCTGASQKKGGITCPACKKRIVIKGKNLIKIE